MSADGLRDRFITAIREVPGPTVTGAADAALAVVTPELERLRGQIRELEATLIVRAMDSGVGELMQRAEQAEDRLRAATDAYARLQAQVDDAEAARDRWQKRGNEAEADIERMRQRLDELIADGHGATTPVLCGLRATLGTPDTAPQRPTSNVPDRISYDTGGELDDVVVNNCMAHLERLDDGRWYLGLYGKDGRVLQIDIASKTGRAAVTGTVTHREGIEGTR